MRFESGDDSTTNVEDRRGSGGGGGMKLGLGGILLVGILSIVFRRNFFALLDQGSEGGGDRGAAPTSAPDDADPRRAREAPLKQVAVRSFNDAQRFFATAAGAKTAYREATLVLFWDRTRSGCGAAGSEMGPFYCPADTKVYIDLAFFDELARRFKAPGDFAQAYVMAHEMGHHAQNVLGVEGKMRREQRADPGRKNDLSVRLELQADCFAGAWASSARTRGLLDPGDLEEGLAAAAAIGDDKIQKMSGRDVRPESFTHGSSAMRVRWFRRGFDTGKLDACETFSATSL